MSAPRKDPVSGRQTTGHEWNGIEELDTPTPRVVLWFLAVTVVFSVICWLLLPAWPTGVSYTKGLLGVDQRDTLARQLSDADAERAEWRDRILAADLSQAHGDPALMDYVQDRGRALFADNCAPCHGAGGAGGPGYPDLTAGIWLWGGEPETVEHTIRVGINSAAPETRFSQMMAFGRDGLLSREQVVAVAAYVRSLSGQALTDRDTALLQDGAAIYAANCVSCHGRTGAGNRDLGAPDLTDDIWLYGGDRQSVQASVHFGRQGHMPHWSERMSDADIRVLALYVGALAGGDASGDAPGRAQ